MAKNDLQIFSKYYDQIYLKMKDYQSESEVVKNIIKQFEKKPSKTLLDVGCGTGEHLNYLSRSFRCKGIDISEKMIATCKAKVPDAEFEIANMIDFNLGEKFDVITCLFSSIGYAETLENLVKTFKKDFQKGKISIDTYEDDKTKLVRMGTSKLTRSQIEQWIINENVHYNRWEEFAKKDFDPVVGAFKALFYCLLAIPVEPRLQ